MEVILSPDQQAKLTRMAHQRGTDAEALAREAIERLLDYDDWFVREVEKGPAQIERGEILSHEDVGARLEKGHPSWSCRTCLISSSTRCAAT
jgi:predicted transcriptional regulator